MPASDFGISEDDLARNPIWLYAVNLVLPLLTIPVFYMLMGYTGLILRDNEQIADAEAIFMGGDNGDLKSVTSPKEKPALEVEMTTRKEDQDKI